MIPWVLTLHIFAVILWIGGLLAAASLLALVPDEVGVAKERFIVGVRRSFVGIHIAAALTIAFGIALIALDPIVLHQGWLHTKLLLVAILLFFHYRLYRRTSTLEDEPGSATRGEFRAVHGIISLLLLAILLLTLIRPF